MKISADDIGDSGADLAYIRAVASPSGAVSQKETFALSWSRFLSAPPDQAKIIWNNANRLLLILCINLIGQFI